MNHYTYKTRSKHFLRESDRIGQTRKFIKALISTLRSFCNGYRSDFACVRSTWTVIASVPLNSMCVSAKTVLENTHTTAQRRKDKAIARRTALKCRSTEDDYDRSLPALIRKSSILYLKFSARYRCTISAQISAEWFFQKSMNRYLN